MSWFGKKKSGDKEITRGFSQETVVKNSNKTITLKVLKNEEGIEDKAENKTNIQDLGIPIDLGSMPVKKSKK